KDSSICLAKTYSEDWTKQKRRIAPSRKPVETPNLARPRLRPVRCKDLMVALGAAPIGRSDLAIAGMTNSRYGEIAPDEAALSRARSAFARLSQEDKEGAPGFGKVQSA